MKCKHCNKEIKDDMKFCPYCGGVIQAEENSGVGHDETSSPEQRDFQLCKSKSFFAMEYKELITKITLQPDALEISGHNTWFAWFKRDRSPKRIPYAAIEHVYCHRSMDLFDAFFCALAVVVFLVALWSGTFRWWCLIVMCLTLWSGYGYVLCVKTSTESLRFPSEKEITPFLNALKKKMLSIENVTASNK